MRQPYTEETAKELFQFIAHGDQSHREWLAEAIEAFRTGKPRPQQR